jgi:hypothetical protein
MQLPEETNHRHLPVELERIVREFSKPLLRYPREYKTVLALMGRKEWSELKQKLSSPEADQVAKALRDYLEASAQEEKCLQIYTEKVCNDDISTFDVTLDERVKIRMEWVDAIGNTLDFRRVLNALV